MDNENNQKKESNKTSETNKKKEMHIKILTYIIVILYTMALIALIIYIVSIQKFSTNTFLNSLLPTIVFILAALALNIVKKIWEKKVK